jgi:hypothetical protein
MADNEQAIVRNRANILRSDDGLGSDQATLHSSEANPRRRPLSLITGRVVGMLTIQVFFHRFSKPMTADNMPESPTPPRNLMSYATQANPRLAWRKIVFMTVLFRLGLYMLFVERL